MEVWRRRILLFCVVTGICLVMYASLEPTVSVRAIDFASRQKGEFGFGEQVAYLKQLPLDAYIEEKIRDRHTIVSGDQWSSFFRDALAVSRGERLPKQWASRITRDDLKSSYRPCRVYFAPDEPPLSELQETFRITPGEPHYLILQDDSQRQFLEVTYHVYRSDAVTFGSGFIDAPSTRFHFPLRRIGYMVLVCGGLVYVLLPRKKRAPDVICFAHWTMIFGDIASLLLFLPFFFLPMLISGGVVQAITLGWFITLVLWPMSMLGAWLLMVMAIYASYEIHVLDDGLEVFNGHHRTFYRFEEMSYLQPLSLRFPAWLTMLMAVAALTSRGANQARLAGQTLIVGSAQSDGMSIGFKDGSAVYLWISNQMGSKVLKNAQRLPQVLQAAGVGLVEEVKVVSALVMPEGEHTDGTRLPSLRNNVLAGLAIFPLAAMGLMLAGWWASEVTDSLRSVDSENASWQEQQLQAEQAQFPANQVAWEQRYRSGVSAQLQTTFEEYDQLGISAGKAPEQSDSYAQGFLRTDDGGFLVFGTAGPSSYLDGYVLRTDEAGQKIWDAHLGAAGKQQDYLDGALLGGDGSILVWGTTGSAGMRAIEGSQALVALLSASGKPVWQTHWGQAHQSPQFCTAIQLEDGSSVLYGVSGSQPNTHCVRLRIDRQGSIVADTQWDLTQQYGDVDLHWVVPTGDGGCVITGEIAVNEQFKNMLVLKLDAEGRQVWQATPGGPKLESGRRVIELEEGGYVAAGVVDEFSGRIKMYLVRIDDSGQLLWERQLDDGAEYTVRDLRQGAHHHLLIAGDLRQREGTPAELCVLEFDIEGNQRWQKLLSQPNVGYSGQAALSSDDGKYFVLGTRTWGNQSADAISLIQLAED